MTRGFLLARPNRPTGEELTTHPIFASTGVRMQGCDGAFSFWFPLRV
jgi:hypothetical protein